MFALAYLSDPNFHPTNPRYRSARPSSLSPVAANYTEACARLSTADEFRNRSGSFSAERAAAPDGVGYLYRVFSYATCIAEIHVVDRRVVSHWITEQKYSVTTSKQTSYVRRYLPAEGATI